MRDSANSLHFKPAIAPVAALTNLNTPIVATILDTFGYGSATLALITGTETDTNATFVTLLEEFNDPAMAGAVAVADIDLIGTEVLAGFQFDDDVECRKLGYIGAKRYCALPSLRPATTLATSSWLAFGFRGTRPARLQRILRTN